MISPVFEKNTGESEGYFGFTCHYPNGRFENVIINYQTSGRENAGAEINALHKLCRNKLNQGEKL